MAGLAAGSYLLGRFIDRRPRRLIRLYALLEAGIGFFALLFPLLLASATPFYTWLYRVLEENLLLLNLARFSICCLLIFIPTFMMGGTLPILIKRFASGTRALGYETGLL
jgi:spermidine synthase